MAQTAAEALLTRLTKVGRALYGEDWQRPIARDLGPYHPREAREQLDDRLVRRWVSGERPVPAWVDTVLPKLLAAGVVRREQEIADLKRAGLELGYPDLQGVALGVLMGHLDSL